MMNDIFGVPIGSIMVALLVMLALCLLSVGWVAWRRPVIFKLGVRNIPRRRAQTVLIVVGLMLSTLIISAALGTGDTLAHSMSADIYDNLGPIDELIVPGQDGRAKVDLTADATFDEATFATIEATFKDDANVDGLLPMLDLHAPVANGESRLAEPDAILTGLDPARLAAFGGLRDLDGQVIDLATFPTDGVVLSESLASDLNAQIGDRISIYVRGQPVEQTVAAIAEDSYLSGLRRSRSTDLETAGMAMPLASLQQLTGQPGRISAIAVSNAGGVRNGMDATDAVVARSHATLTSQGLGIDPIKQDRIERSDSIATLFTTVFLVLGLFSVAAGILLIVLIFTMLAAERRPEMGMARAVGAQRRQIIQQFVAEGTAYAFFAGLVGAALGLLATFGIGVGMNAIFGDFAQVEPHVDVRSLVVAYALGMVITFLSIVGSSWKISRLNIVAAVRDIPDVVAWRRQKRTLIWGVLLLITGGLLTLSGLASDQAIFYMTGLSLLPFGVALVFRFFGAPSRLVFSTVALVLLIFWLLPEDAYNAIFGEYNGEISMFFISGVFLVIAATILIVNNLDVLLAGLNRLGGVFPRQLPAIRTAIAFPGAAKGRTGLTVAMFSLIIFSLVMMATMSQNFSNLLLGDEANAGWHVRADALGAEPIADFTGELQRQGVDTGKFAAPVGIVRSPSASVSDAQMVDAADQAWKQYPVHGMNETFIAGSTLTFGQRAVGYESDAAIIEALHTQPDVAVVDQTAVPQEGNLGADDEDVFSLTGVSSAAEIFDPVQVELVNPRDGSTHVITIIGVLDEEIATLKGLYAAQPTIDRIYGQSASTSYYVALRDAGQADAVAKEIEAALLMKGVQGIAIADELADAQSQSMGFLYIIQGFMGLGLVVGIAAVGVIAFRSVVERRQQIGVLRALGFQRATVALSFLVETTFLVGLGGFAGTVLGLVLARNLFTSDAVGSSDANFAVPWAIIVVIAGLTNAAALLMTWIPARRASHIAPAEALRYE